MRDFSELNCFTVQYNNYILLDTSLHQTSSYSNLPSLTVTKIKDHFSLHILYYNINYLLYKAKCSVIFLYFFFIIFI